MRITFRVTEDLEGHYKALSSHLCSTKPSVILAFALQKAASTLKEPVQMSDKRAPKIQWTKPRRELGAVDILTDDGEVQVVMDPDAEGYVNPIYKPPKQNNG